MVNDCKEEWLPLEKELKMMEDYIGLEKVRYGDRLNLQVIINGSYKNKSIAPLIMLPFLENCFKHGASQVLEHPWIKININIGEDSLLFDVSNSKPDQTSAYSGKGGIALSNIRRRLELLYRNRHTLEIEPGINEFSVRLRVPLHVDKNTEGTGRKQGARENQTISYA